MEILRDILLIFLAFLAGSGLGQISGYKDAFKDFNNLIERIMDDDQKESKEN